MNQSAAGKGVRKIGTEHSCEASITRSGQGGSNRKRGGDMLELSTAANLDEFGTQKGGEKLGKVRDSMGR